ncbi:MAG: triose-phosphate isomerase [SAR86 cluster bacterium]|uniref:Triosephosphate isomerase n=1 Tax=SAR86 cluster bacterium TaxID=2030880 RepID=A0A2A4XF44_9GAMM|nr:MAG: triose-phosphate isomerase [SAR86 cluster bacterium]
MRQKLVVGNWKMHGSRTQVRQLIESVAASTADLKKVEIAVGPTLLHIGFAAELCTSEDASHLKLAAQNLFTEPEGAFTGEVSAPMLAEYGVNYVIVGHSERREFFAETDQVVAAKFKATQASGMIPILCVGESLSQREAGTSAEVVLTQLNAVIQSAGIEALQYAVLAYEPLWAIGTGKTASKEQAQEIHHVLREHIAKSNATIAEDIRILYGGSVKAANAAELFSQADIDGGLVGGASLKAEEFVSICKSAD